MTMGESRLLCSHCGRSFATRSDLRDHEAQHLERLRGWSAFTKHLTLEDRALLKTMRIGWDDD